MSDLISEKVKEARLLLQQAEAEETEGNALTAQIKALQARSDALLQSAREKRAIGAGQLDVIETLSRGSALVVVAAAPAEPAKKRGGRRKAAPVAATPAAPTPAPTAVKATKGAKGAKGTNAKGKAKAEKTVTAPVAAAPAAKPAKAKPASKPKKGATPAAAESADPTTSIVRVPAERNGLPPLRDRLKTVIGNDEVAIAEAIARLKAHNKAWVPDSEDLSAYISLVLSTHAKPGDVFERVRRGIYRVAKGGSGGGVPVAALSKPSPAPSKGGKKGPAKTNGSNGHSNGIEDLGDNVMDNPFSGATAAE